MNPDDLAALEEERRFLLRSIVDLEREHAAGDVEDADFAALRDGYVARAATVLREIDAGTAASRSRSPRRPGVLVAWVVGTVAVAVLAGVLVARSSGQRTDSTSQAPAPAEEVNAELSRARSALSGGDASAAVASYRRVLALDDGNVEALAYVGWLIAGSGGTPAEVQIGVDQLRAAVARDPGYADAHCLLAEVLVSAVVPPARDEARVELDACAANDPPAVMEGLIVSLRAALDAPDSSG